MIGAIVTGLNNTNSDYTGAQRRIVAPLHQSQQRDRPPRGG